MSVLSTVLQHDPAVKTGPSDGDDFNCNSPSKVHVEIIPEHRMFSGDQLFHSSVYGDALLLL